MVTEETALTFPGTIFQAIVKSYRLMRSNCLQAKGIMCYFLHVYPFRKVVAVQSIVILEDVVLRKYIDKRLDGVAFGSLRYMAARAGARKLRYLVPDVWDRGLVEVEQSRAEEQGA